MTEENNIASFRDIKEAAMKNSKTCIKCGGNNIVMIKNDGHPDGTYGNNIQCRATVLSGVVFVERYICCDCGYTEEWIDRSDMASILNSKKIFK